MINIFLGYRHGGDTGWSSMIEKTLKRKPEIDVFRDTTNIKLGEPFPARLEREIESRDVVLVLIGSSWITDITRLTEPEDWVRREILHAKKHNKLIIPVLLNGTSMPKAASLPTELRFITDLNAESVEDRTSDYDIGELATFIRNEFKQQNDTRKWTTLNGLRGVLNLALNLKESANAEVVKQLGSVLMPELFVDDAVNEPNETGRLIYRVIENRDRLLKIEGISYTTIELNSETTVQIGIDVSSSSSVLVIYERLAKDSLSAKLLVMFYPPKGGFVPNNLSDILSELTEPRSAITYRLPFKSLFIGKIISETALRHSYKPYDENGEIDSSVLVKLFDLEWIGSSEVEIKDLKTFHSFLTDHYGDFTIIHATEWASKTSI